MITHNFMITQNLITQCDYTKFVKIQSLTTPLKSL